MHSPHLPSSCHQESLPALHAGLADSDDDVRAASADALVPLAPTLFRLGMPAVQRVRTQLWDLLGRLDELSPATSSVMQVGRHAGSVGIFQGSPAWISYLQVLRSPQVLLVFLCLQLLAQLYAPVDLDSRFRVGSGSTGTDSNAGPGLASSIKEEEQKINVVKKNEDDSDDEEEDQGWVMTDNVDMMAAIHGNQLMQQPLVGGSSSGLILGGGGRSKSEADDLVCLVPRLWLFFRHSLMSVRLSAMQCLERLLTALKADPLGASWLPPLSPALLLLTFQVSYDKLHAISLLSTSW